MLDFIVDILSEPSVLVGGVALIDLVLQKKSFSRNNYSFNYGIWYGS